jgi:hypothetical protein
MICLLMAAPIAFAMATIANYRLRGAKVSLVAIGYPPSYSAP